MGLLSKGWIFLRFLVAWIYTLFMSLLACVGSVLVGPSRAWLLCCRPWARGTLWLVGVELDIEGVENLRGPAVFVSNHQSLIDVVFMPAILPRTVRFVAKRELLYIPLWGWAFAAGGAVLINRKNPRQALQELRRGLRRLPKGWSVVVFPEGTRPKDGVMRGFKKGAFHIAVASGLPVVPVGMDGARDIVPPDGWLVYPGQVRVTVGKPLDTSHWTSATIDAHVAEGRAAVERCVARSVQRRGEHTGPSPSVPLVVA